MDVCPTTTYTANKRHQTRPVQLLVNFVIKCYLLSNVTAKLRYSDLISRPSFGVKNV